jgi:hypothetical protein
MLQQFVVPNPALGADWRWVVPGEYVARIVSVAATLTSNTPPATLADSSGNGWTLTVDQSTHVTFGTAGPFAGGAGNVAVTSDGSSPPVQQQGIGHTAFDPSWIMPLFTAEAWVKADNNNSAFGYNIIVALTVNASNGWQMFYGHTAGSPTSFRQQVPFQGASPANTLLTRNVWHHLAVSYDGANWNQYVDGALVLSQAVPNRNDGGSMRIELGGGNISPLFSGQIGPCSVYNAVVGAARIAAHAAANADKATYKASVLTDTPKGFWLLDELQTTVQRTASLRMTDGTRTLALFPGFTATSTSGTFQWTWASASPGNAQNVNQTVTQVVIADETLQPGYTVGTSTPDLGIGDQWSNIVVWADVSDSGYGPGGPPGFDSGYLEALLTPDYSHRGF